MRLLPLLPIAVGLAVVAVLRPNVFTSAAGSWRAWVAVLVVAALASGTRLLVRRWSPTAAPWASSSVALALLGVLLLPSFQQQTVNEDFPEAAAESVVSPSPPASTPAASAPASARAATASRLAAGPLKGIDHSASGRSALYEVGDKPVLRFEDIDVEGTPEPVVFLVRKGARSPEGGIRIGDLKGERGSFSYATPSGFEPAKGWTALVWCMTYDVPIAAADLA